eukprot:3379181-Amphidinium_carterae.1
MMLGVSGTAAVSLCLERPSRSSCQVPPRASAHTHMHSCARMAKWGILKAILNSSPQDQNYPQSIQLSASTALQGHRIQTRQKHGDLR